MKKALHLTTILLVTLLSFSSKTALAKDALHFIPNMGQVADLDGNLCPDVLYTSRAPGADLYFRKTGFSYVLTEPILFDERGKEIPPSNGQGIHRVDLVFNNANTDVVLSPENLQEGLNNYYYAHCSEGVLNVPVFGKLTYKGLYDNVDLVIYASEDGFKYDFLIQPGGDPSVIEMEYIGAAGLSLIDEEALEIKTSLGSISETIPLSYQGSEISQSHRDKVPCSYVLDGNKIRFEIPEWDENKLLVIDPVSTWATFYGGNGIDYGRGVASDNFGYQSGETASSNLPTSPGAHQVAFGGNRDAYIVKWTKAGTRLWGTYYGGTGRDASEDVAVDGNGNSFITGYAGSGFPTTAGAFQPAFTNGEDGFLVKFDPNGARLWATYLGGESNERALDVATDPSGNIVVAGYTESNFQIATAGVVQTSRSGNDDAFVMKFNTSGARLWGSYLGGSRLDEAHGVTCDASGNVIIAGRTYGNFPVGACCGNTAFQTSFGGSFGDMDMFITKLNPSGTTRLWSTYYGGPNVERAYDVEVDAAGNVIAAGNAWANFPSTFGTIQPFFGGGMGDAAVVKFDPTGNRLWATYIGGSSYDLGFSVDAVGTNDIIIAGETESFFSTINQCQTTCSGTYCGFIVHLDGNGATRIMSTVLGGSSLFNSVLDVSVDASSNIFTTGFTNSTNYPVGGSSVFQPVYGGGSADAFMGIYNDDSCNAVILSADILELHGELVNDQVELSWNATNGSSNDHSEVERSIDKINFERIGQHPYLSSGEQHVFNDSKALAQQAQTLFYRLTSVNQNGEKHFSQIVAIALPIEEGGLRLFPNPAENRLQFALPLNTENYSVTIFNANGMEVFRDARLEESDKGAIDISGLNSGMYIFKLQTNKLTITRRFIKR